MFTVPRKGGQIAISPFGLHTPGRFVMCLLPLRTSFVKKLDKDYTKNMR